MTRSHRLLPLFLLALGLPSLGCGGTPATTAAAPPEPDPPKAEPRSTIDVKARFFPNAWEAARARRSATIDAGEVDYARPRDFTFIVANTGGSPLTLTLTRKSCSCAEVTVPDPIAPGAEGRVVVHWAPIPGNVGAYTVWADIMTNDPQNESLRLEVKSFIRPLVHVFVEGRENNSFIDFGDDPVPPGQQRAREVQVFSTTLEHFDLDDPKLPGFEIKKTPLPPGTPVEGARCGYLLELRTTDQLPYGYVRADLPLTLRKLSDQPDRTITVSVYAVIGSGIFSVGRPGLFLFRKPNITDEDTAKVIVTFIVKPSKEKESVEVASYEPKFLKVDPPQSLGGGRWVITARLEQGNAEAAKFQPDAPVEGQVVLKVSGLDRPVPIRVKWDPLPK
jgi:hypothetical protein